MSSTPIYDELAATYLTDVEPREPAAPPADPDPDAAPPGHAADTAPPGRGADTAPPGRAERGAVRERTRKRPKV